MSEPVVTDGEVIVLAGTEPLDEPWNVADEAGVLMVLSMTLVET